VILRSSIENTLARSKTNGLHGVDDPLCIFDGPFPCCRAQLFFRPASTGTSPPSTPGRDENDGTRSDVLSALNCRHHPRECSSNANAASVTDAACRFLNDSDYFEDEFLVRLSEYIPRWILLHHPEVIRGGATNGNQPSAPCRRLANSHRNSNESQTFVQALLIQGDAPQSLLTTTKRGQRRQHEMALLEQRQERMNLPRIRGSVDIFHDSVQPQLEYHASTLNFVVNQPSPHLVDRESYRVKCTRVCRRAFSVS
jgi:hypothetical protein